MKIKNILTFAFVAVMLITMTVMVGAAEPVTGLSGTGTADDPYQIGTLDELKWFRDDVNNGNNYSGKYIILTNDIDISSETDWTPIGNGTNKFTGYFNGQSKTISGLTITSSPEYAGLFGYVSGPGMSNNKTPSVQNLILSQVDVRGGQYTGALSGRMFTTYVKDIKVTGNVDGGKFTGGIVGHVYTLFEDCSFTGTVVSINQSGGIAGSGDCRAYNCKVVGDITAEYWAGGIVGNGQEGTTAVNCYVKGTITANSNWYYGVGGIAGVAGHGYAGSEFSNNYFDGEVYLEENKVDTVVVGFINASGEAVKTEVEGNSWNTENYPADLNVVIAEADMPSSSPTAEEHASAARETVSRNNNIVGSISDVQYIESGDVTIVGDAIDTEDITDGLNGNEQFDITIDPNTGAASVVKYVAKIGDEKQTDLKTAIGALKSNDTLTIFAGTYEIGAVKLPNNIENVTIQGAPNEAAILKNSTISASDGGAVSYINIKFDGIVFDNSIILLTGQRSEVVYKDITINNCEFKNIVRGDNYSAVHMNVNSAKESVENFTFTNNIIDGVSGSSNSGINISAVRGTVTIKNNVIKNVAWNAIQVRNSTGTVTLTIEGNTFESAKANGDDGIVNLYGYKGTACVTNNTMTENAASQPFFCYVSNELKEDGFVYGGTFYGSDETLADYIADECEIFQMAPGEYAVAEDKPYTVTYIGYGSETVQAGTVLPEFRPDNDGYELVGWYTEQEFVNKFDFSRPIIEDVTLYPMWKTDYHDIDTGYVMIIMKMLKKLDISVEIIEAEGGKIVVVEPENVKYNKPAVCTIVADEGYAVADVIVDGESVGAVTEYTIEKLKGKHTVTAVFEKITADTDGEQ